MKPLSCSIAARAALLGVTMAALAFAPRDAFSQGRPDRDVRGQVCVYEHADYGGWEKCFGVGESIRDIGDLRDQISSVRFRGPVEVALYEHPNFQGRQVHIDSDIRDLRRWDRRWNDEVDSLEVSKAGFRGRRPDSRYSEDRVCVYQHTNFQGHSQCWDAGDEIVDLKQIGWNDGISSIRTFGPTKLAVYEHSGFKGRRLIVDGDIPDLTRVDMDGGSNWNDRISSVRIGDGWDRRRGRR